MDNLVAWLQQKLRNTGIHVRKHRGRRAPGQRGPYNLLAGPFPSSMEKHCEGPGSPSAREGCASLANKNGFRRPGPMCPLSAGSLLVLAQTKPLFCFRRVFPSSHLGWLFSAPCQIEVSPRADDGSSDAASGKMVVSCLHNGSG